MSGVIPSHDVVVVREGEAEVVGGGPVTGRLYADSSATGGALSSQRITLLGGAAGATPHHHTGSSELFYVVSGAAEMLTGQRVLTAREGDLVVVPPGTVHAFAAAPASDADLLIILTPGVERFAYFRHLQRIASGAAPLESILDVQDLYDNHFDDSPAWQQALAARM
jgi:quercetin dioxygenase-like cupin family protein